MQRKRLMQRALSGRIRAGAGHAAALCTPGTLAAALLWTAPAASGQIIEEILVTAQKREERIVDVPISVSAFDTDAIRDQTISDLIDLGTKLPNVVAGGRFEAGFTIRGISSSSAGPGFPPGVGVNVDEVFLGRDRAFNTVLFDIAGVELLRGPQGTLYGKNTIAGTVNVRTRRPTDEFEAAGDLWAGNHGLVQFRGTLSGPLGEKVRARVSGMTKERDGFLDNPLLGRDFNDVSENGGRGMVQFLPSEDLTIELFGDFYAQDDNSGVLETVRTFDGNVLPFPPFTSVAPTRGTDRKVHLDIPHFRERDIWGTSARIVYERNGYEFTSVTAYREFESDFRDDSDGAPLDLFDVGRAENLERFSQELRIASPAAETFAWIVGAYFDREDLESFREIRIGEHFPTPILGLPPLPPGFQELAETNVTLESDSWSVFASGSYDLTERLELAGGVRFTHEEKDLAYSQLPTLVSLGIVGLFALPIPLFEDRYEDDAVSGDVSLSYHFTPDRTGYFRYAHGFKAGGFQADVISPPPFTPPTSLSFNPETVDSYEIGFKGLWFDRRLGINVAAFYFEFSDKQEQVNTGVSFVVSNAAEASSRGAEVELYATPLPGLDIIANLGVLDAEYDSFPNGGGLGVHFSGNELAGAPGVTGSFAVQYATPLAGMGGVELTLRGEVDHVGEFFSQPANDPEREVDAYTPVNARIGIRGREGNWEVTLWGRNLNDDLVLGGGSSLLGVILTRSINIGRTYGIEVRLRR